MQWVKQDYNKAKEYYEKATELGNSNAMFKLGPKFTLNNFW